MRGEKQKARERQMRQTGMGYLRYFTAAVFITVLWPCISGVSEAQEKAARLQATAGVEASYVTNVFNLSSDQQDQLEANSPADQTSGRYKDMDSVSDLIVTPRLRLSSKQPGLGGKELQIKPGIAYNLYMQNAKKSHVELGVGLRQDVGDTGTLGLDVSYSPDVFKKNYLSDATDLTGSVTDAERVYKPAKYDDLSVDLSYRRKLWKAAKVKAGPSSVESVYGEFLVGLQMREFNSDFVNRDEDSVRAGFGATAEFSNNMDLAANYTFEAVEAPAGTEVLILDEPDFGVDFNNDADSLDNNIRTVQGVDRSRNEHTITLKARAKLSKDWTGQARYDYRLQDYKSTERFDSAYNNREDKRHRLGLGLQRELAARWSLALGCEFVKEKTSRGPSANIDPAEPKSYENMILTGALSYRL